MTKRLIALTVASAFAVASAGAIAESPSSRPVSKAVPMSDAQLDQITAGSATSTLILNNPGNHAQARVNNNHTTLINTVAGDSITVVTGNGRVMTHCIGGGTC